MKTEFKNVVWKEGKYFVAQCLNIEVSSFGETKEEALKNLNEAIELYMKMPLKIILTLNVFTNHHNYPNQSFLGK